VTALAALSVEAGSGIALPAYICRSVPDALTRHGYRPLFLDPDPDLLLPLEPARAMIRSGEVRAAVLVDYFGFLADRNAPLARALGTAGAVVLEDRCHGGLCNPGPETADNAADAVIHSLRKTLPVRDGGALLRNSGNADRDLENPAPWSGEARFLLLRLVEEMICTLGWLNIYGGAMTAAKGRQQEALHDPVQERGEIAETPAPCAPSPLLARQLRDTERLARITAQRQANYDELAKALESLGLHPLWSRCSPGDAPQILPLRDPHGGLAEHLRNHGVGTYQWPGPELPATVSADPNRFPRAISLNRELVCLPVHQSLRPKHLHRMVELITRWLEQKTSATFTRHET